MRRDILAPRCLFGLFVLTAFACSAAWAEDEDSLSPKGLWIGKLRFAPSVASSLRYTDNSLWTEHYRKSDWVHEHLPSLNLSFAPSEALSLGAGYTFGWHDYMDNTARDFLSHEGSFDLFVRHLGTEGLSLKVNDRYVQTGHSEAIENEVLPFVRYHRNRASVGLQYGYNRFTFGGSYANFFIDYFSRRQSAQDYMAHEGEMTGEFHWLPDRLIIFTSYEAVRTLYRESDDYDFDTHTVMAGVKGDYGKLQFSAAGGYAFARALHPEGRNADGPSFDVTLAYAPHERLSFSLYGGRRFTASAGSGYTTETNAGATATVMLTDRAPLSVSVLRHESDREGGDRLVSLNGRIHFEYKFTRNVSATATLSRSQRDSRDGADFVVHDIGAGLRLAW